MESLDQITSTSNYSSRVADLDEYSWTKNIHGDGLSLHRLTGKKNAYFDAICSMYELEEETLTQELKSMVIWTICNEKNEVIGAVQIDHYSSLEALREQVSDEKLSQELFAKGSILELSYALQEKCRGHGIGSKAVQLWIDDALKNQWGKKLFAVVEEKNHPSIRILEKNGFTYHGKYFHPKTKENIFLYSI